MIKKLKKKNIFGFTLAEVLITLGIIGVVATMTIPTLMAHVENQQYIEGLKKTYSEFNQILQQMSLEADSVQSNL